MAGRNKKYGKKSPKKGGKYDPKSKDSKDLKESKDNSYDVKDQGKNKEPWNKAEWYIPDPKIREQVASFSVNSTTGIPQIINGVNTELTYDVSNPVLYGDVMSISLFPYPGTIGLTTFTSGVSALDTACRKLYTAISSVNSKTTQYTPESLGIAIIAVGELISLISYAQRAYGVAFTYNPRNRMLPVNILKAMGLTTSILDDLPNFRMQLNKLITSSNNIRMLNDLKYFTKCWEIYANYFEDNSSGLAQYYVMRPAGYLKYVETSPTTGELEWVSFGSAGTMSHLTLIQHIQTCLNNLLTSSLMNYVYTDIVNYVAKEGGAMLGFDYIGELYAVLPIQDATFLTQVHNMTWGMYDLNTTQYKVFEDPLTLTIKTTDIFNHAGTDANARLALATDKIIDFPFTDNPSADDKIDAIAYTSMLWDIDNNGDPTGLAAPDHPVNSVEILRNDNFIFQPNQIINYATGTMANVIEYLRDFGTFSVYPTLYAYYYDSTHQETYPMGSLNYFTIMKFKQLKNIFDFSFLGLFDAEVKGVKPF